MDQLRTTLAWLKRHHFWVLTGLIVVIGLGCWWRAAGTLSAEFEKNKSQITAEFNSLTSLRANPFHPNEVINEKQAAEIEKLAKDVGVIWEKLYDRQRKQVLEWPAVLGKDFHDAVAKLEFGADIPKRQRQVYIDYVEGHFPKLPEKIGARPLRENEMLGGSGEFTPSRSFSGEVGLGRPSAGVGESEDDGDYIVEWLDQGHVREELNIPTRPSALRIWWTQENLWVYHTLLDVIRNTNEAAGATRMSNAAVRTIYSLEVGRSAGQGSRTKDRIYKVPMAAPAPGGDMMGEFVATPEAGMEGPMGEMPGGPAMFREGGGGQGQMSPAEEAAALFSHRYLGEDGKPLPFGGGGGEFVDPSAPAPTFDSSAFGKEYKRLPVRMALEMDQRWLPELISECASQPLQVEVQEVRINPAGGIGSEGGGFAGGMRGGFEGGGMAGNLFPDRSGVQTFPQQPQMVNVVVQGIIYIFNKPDPDSLTSSEETSLANLAPPSADIQ